MTSSGVVALSYGDKNYQLGFSAPEKAEIPVAHVSPSEPVTASITVPNVTVSSEAIEAADAAPNMAKISGDREKLNREYIRRFQRTAIEEMKKFGIPASISLAQGILESGAGTSTLSLPKEVVHPKTKRPGANNHFGMKCFSKKCKKGHCMNFTDDHHKDFFRIYNNAWESWRAHSQMLSSGRYTTLKKYGKDYRNWAYGLKKLGYATDRNYAEKLIGIIEEYKLQRIDQFK